MNAESPSEELIEQIVNVIRNGEQDDHATAPADPAILASQEFASMSPTARQEYSNRQLIETLNNQIEQLGTQFTESNRELADARNELLELGTLRHSHRSGRWIGAVTAIAMATGGGLISSFSAGDVAFGIGWGLTIVGSVILLGKSVFDW